MDPDDDLERRIVLAQREASSLYGLLHDEHVRRVDHFERVLGARLLWHASPRETGIQIATRGLVEDHVRLMMAAAGATAAESLVRCTSVWLEAYRAEMAKR